MKHLWTSVFMVFVTMTVARGATTTPVPNVPDSALCWPSLFGSDNSLFEDRFPVADDAFDRQHYRLAFHAYYQYFVCLNGSRFNPAAEDSGAAGLVVLALAAAAHGDDDAATERATSAMTTDERMSEAPFILGDLYWIAGKHHLARTYWRTAAERSGYPTPPGPQSSEPAAIAAQRMLHVHPARTREQ